MNEKYGESKYPYQKCYFTLDERIHDDKCWNCGCELTGLEMGGLCFFSAKIDMDKLVMTCKECNAYLGFIEIDEELRS